MGACDTFLSYWYMYECSDLLCFFHEVLFILTYVLYLHFTCLIQGIFWHSVLIPWAYLTCEASCSKV